MSWLRHKERAERLRAVPLESVLRFWGAQPDRYDRFKWHTPQGTLSITGTKFLNWTQGVGGGGAIDLVMHLNQADFKEALQWLGSVCPVQPVVLCTALQAGFQLPPVRSPLISARQRLLGCGTCHPRRPHPGAHPAQAPLRHHTNALVLLERAMSPWAPNYLNILARPAMAPKDLGFFSAPANHDGPTASPEAIIHESTIDAPFASSFIPATAVFHRCARPTSLAGHSGRAAYFIYCGFDADPTEI
jgi:hypothetical protein